jgi:hypothetical protein
MRRPADAQASCCDNSGKPGECPLRERLKPPQPKRKAPQTARGFNCGKPGGVYLLSVRQERSAQADITLSQPRIHSPPCVSG